MRVEINIFNTKFTYCEAYGAPLLLIYLQAISTPIYMLYMYCKCSLCYLFGPFGIYQTIMIVMILLHYCHLHV